MTKNIETLCVRGERDANNRTGALTTPIYQSATFSHLGVNQSTGYDYSRLQNPTREVLENHVALLEGGCKALAFSSGMAALNVLCELFAPGEHIVATNDLYGGMVRLLNNVVKKNGTDVSFVDTSDLTALENALNERTKAVFIETPSNPMMLVTDIASVSEICKKRGVMLIVDNTFLTPIYQKPLELGADVVVHSGTKYLGGHNDTLAGFLVTNNAEIAEKLMFLYKTVGSCLAPWDCFLIERGIKTLAIRMEVITNNARKIANWLEVCRKIEKVRYVGKGGMIAFSVDCEETAHKILNGVKVILYAESLGGVETLITYPLLQTHADVAIEVREALGINSRLLRLSVGIEHADDIIADLEEVLK